jgi:hypothetical protein
LQKQGKFTFSTSTEAATRLFVTSNHPRSDSPFHQIRLTISGMRTLAPQNFSGHSGGISVYDEPCAYG